MWLLSINLMIKFRFVFSFINEAFLSCLFREVRQWMGKVFTSDISVNLFVFSDNSPSNCFTLGHNVHRIRSTITFLHNFHSYSHYLHVFLCVRHILEMRHGIIKCGYYLHCNMDVKKRITFF